jgi:hypothetical protein
MKRAKMLFILIMIIFVNLYFSTNIKAEERFVYNSVCEYVSLDGRYAIELEKHIRPSLTGSDVGMYYFTTTVISGKYFSLDNDNKTFLKEFSRESEDLLILDFGRDNIDNPARCDEKITYNSSNNTMVYYKQGDEKALGTSFVFSKKTESNKYFPNQISCKYDRDLTIGSSSNTNIYSLLVEINRIPDEGNYTLRILNGSKEINTFYYGVDLGEASNKYIDKLVSKCPRNLYYREGKAFTMTDLEVEMAVVKRNLLGNDVNKIMIFTLFRTQSELNDVEKQLDQGMIDLIELEKKYSECVENNESNCDDIKKQMLDKSNELDYVCLDITTSKDFSQVTKEKCKTYVEIRSRLEGRGLITSFTHGCNMLSEAMRDFINWILSLIKIAAPIVVIVFSTLDFVKAAASSEADANKKAFDKFVKRLIMASVVFLIPAIVQFIFNYFEVYAFANGLEPSNPFCL